MILRLLISLVCVGFLLLFFLPKGQTVDTANCVVRSCEMGYEEGCITKEESANVDENCKDGSCQCIHSPKDICYKNHGTCAKVENGCGWHKSSELESCLKMVEAAENIKNEPFYSH